MVLMLQMLPMPAILLYDLLMNMCIQNIYNFKKSMMPYINHTNKQTHNVFVLQNDFDKWPR